MNEIDVKRLYVRIREQRLITAAAETIKYFGKGAHGTQKLQQALEFYTSEDIETARELTNNSIIITRHKDASS